MILSADVRTCYGLAVLGQGGGLLVVLRHKVIALGLGNPDSVQLGSGGICKQRTRVITILIFPNLLGNKEIEIDFRNSYQFSTLVIVGTFLIVGTILPV